MADPQMGEILYPQSCRIGASADGKQVALTFQVADREPLTVVLPLLGAAGLLQRTGQVLHRLGVRAKPRATTPATPAAPAEQEAA